jgi:hypothetical protein
MIQFLKEEKQPESENANKIGASLPLHNVLMRTISYDVTGGR